MTRWNDVPASGRAAYREKEDPDSFLALSCAEFNAFNAIDIMEDMIDTKIYYMNLREEE